MKLEQEFKKYLKDFASKVNYDISNEELDELYNGFFGKEIGIVNMMISSKIQDFIFAKDQELNKDNNLEMEK